MNNYGMSDFQYYVYLSRYSRFIHEEGRRETWPETVARYFNFFSKSLKEKHSYDLSKNLRKELESAVISMEIMPSMRCVMTAGPALERDNIAAYNCAYVAIDSPRTFSEIMMTLMCGTGVGFSVESQCVNKLPEVPDELEKTDSVIIVADSKVGWAKAINELITMLYLGHVPRWDVTKIRPSGSILKTFGGRASGPGPLEKAFKFIVETFYEARGRKLTSLECHDICCCIGEAVVVGGVRRSAMISISDLVDDKMRNAKSGQWWTFTPWRSLANNSAVYLEKKPSMEVFMTEWKALYDSKSGERGFFSRYAAKNVINRANEFKKKHFGNIENIRYRNVDFDWGCNPCSEILLRDKQYCNLTEVVIRENDTEETLSRKVRLATILGTFQSTLTDFRFISKKWKQNTEDERLLGVSLTGIMDNKLTSGKEGEEKLKNVLTTLRKVAIETNLKLSKEIGIPSSTAITCIKPSGTVSSLVDSSAGIHGRHSAYYIRSVRSDKKDPLAKLLIDSGIPHEEDVMRPESTWVFYFPIKSPKTALFRDSLSSVEQLNFWLIYQMYWCDHKPSVTVSVKEDEWMKTGSWVYDNFEWVSGISFLPYSDHNYSQAPYNECAKEEYETLLAKMPKTISWEKLKDYEKTDMTTGSQELSCAAGGCDL